MNNWRKKRIRWSFKDERMLIKMWRERLSELNSVFNRNPNIYNEMSEEFQKKGKQIKPIEIQTKICNLKSKYKRTMSLMELSHKFSKKWPLFDEVQDIMQSDQANESGPDSNADADVGFEDISAPIHEFETWDNSIVNTQRESANAECSGYVVQQTGRKKRHRWTEQEESILLTLWHERQAQLLTVQRKSDVFREMYADFQKSGLKREPLEIRNKVESLTMKYRKMKESLEMYGKTPKYWPHFNKVCKILGDELFNPLVKQEEEDAIEAPQQTSSVTTDSGSSTCDASFSQANDMSLDKNALPEDDKQYHRFWTEEEELMLVNMMHKRKAVFESCKQKTPIYREMSAEFQKLGIELQLSEIKNKIGSLKAKFRYIKQSLASNDKTENDWPLFDKIREIYENQLFHNLDAPIKKEAEEEDTIEGSDVEFMDISAPFHQFETVANDKSQSANAKCSDNVKQHNVRKKRHFWTEQQESMLVSMWHERQAEFCSTRKKSHIYENMSADFHKSGMKIKPIEIKHKIDNLSSKYRKRIAKMEISAEGLDDWPLFDAIRNILEDDNYKEQIENINESSASIQEDVDYKHGDKIDYDDHKGATEISIIEFSDTKLEPEENQEHTVENMQPEIEQQPLDFEVFYLNERQSTSTTNANKIKKKPLPDSHIILKNIKQSQLGFHCPHCNQVFKNRCTLKTHIRRHLGIKIWSCEICGKGFPDASKMRIHMQRHLRIKPHLCEICGKAFTTSTELGTHMRHHTKEKPYKCNKCPSTFSSSTSLQNHKRRHGNERPFACQSCKKRFFSKQRLNAHTKIHTKERFFECAICQKKFAQPVTLYQHMKLHSWQKAYKCQYCNATFAQHSGLYIHLRSCRKKRKQQANELENPNSAD